MKLLLILLTLASLYAESVTVYNYDTMEYSEMYTSPGRNEVQVWTHTDETPEPYIDVVDVDNSRVTTYDSETMEYTDYSIVE